MNKILLIGLIICLSSCAVFKRMEQKISEQKDQKELEEKRKISLELQNEFFAFTSLENRKITFFQLDSGARIKFNPDTSFEIKTGPGLIIHSDNSKFETVLIDSTRVKMNDDFYKKEDTKTKSSEATKDSQIKKEPKSIQIYVFLVLIILALLFLLRFLIKT